MALNEDVKTPVLTNENQSFDYILQALKGSAAIKTLPDGAKQVSIVGAFAGTHKSNSPGARKLYKFVFPGSIATQMLPISKDSQDFMDLVEQAWLNGIKNANFGLYPCKVTITVYDKGHVFKGIKEADGTDHVAVNGGRIATVASSSKEEYELFSKSVLDREVALLED